MSGGQQIDVGQGGLTYRVFRPAIIVEQGFLSAEGAPITVGLSGAEFEARQQTIVPAAPLLLGQSIPCAAGTLTPIRDKALIGVATAAGSGFISSNLNPDDTFIESRFGAVAVVPEVTLTGIAITVTPGSVVYSLGALVGEQLTVGQGSVGIFGVGAALTGSGMSSAHGVITQIGGVTPPPEDHFVLDTHDGWDGEIKPDRERKKKRKKKDDVREDLVEAFKALSQDPSVATQVKAIVREHIEEDTGTKVVVNFDSISEDREAINKLMRLFRTLPKQEEDEDDEEEAIKLLLS